MNFVVWELIGLLVVILLSATHLIPAGRATRRARRWWTHLGNQPRLSVLIVALMGFSLSAVTSLGHVPVPAVHDEFSYLLAADTFAHGRLANPTHPHWQHFESFHVIHQPTYASKYPPLPGLLLALGTVIGGHSVVGVWIGVGLAAGTLCWMLRGWLPGRWAFLGGLIFVFHPAILSNWAGTYWGGAVPLATVPLAGGAAVLGALPRLLRGGTMWNGVAMCLGAAVLANSRPYEGLIVCLVAAGVLLYRLCSGRFPGGQFFHCLVLPAVVILPVTAVAMGYYNFRVTGSPFRLPYQLHEEQYAAYPLFLWKSPPPEPAYRHPVMRAFHVEWGLASYRLQRDLGGWLRTKAQLFGALWLFYSGIVLTIPLLTGLCHLGRRDVRFWLAALLVALAATSLVPWTHPHYIAPSASLLWLLIIQGWRSLTVCGPRWRGFGRRLALGLFLLNALLFSAQWVEEWRSEPTGWQWGRQEIQDRLQSTPGKHLVFVHYSSAHNTFEEWVYNEAEIDSAQVVWARIMSPQRNRELIDYFADRRVWILDADARPPILRSWTARP